MSQTLNRNVKIAAERKKLKTMERVTLFKDHCPRN